MAENEDGYWAGDFFIYDYDKIARETGYTVDQVKMYGVAHCRNNPQESKFQGNTTYLPVADFEEFKGSVEGIEAVGYLKYAPNEVVPEIYVTVTGQPLPEPFANVEIVSATSGKRVAVVTGVMQRHTTMPVTLHVKPLVPTAKHNGEYFLGFEDHADTHTVMRHPLRKGSLTAPRELLLYRKNDQYVVHIYNMQDGGLYDGSYHGTDFLDALGDFHRRLAVEKEQHGTQPWTYDPKEVT